MKALAIIPARGGSKRVPGKNLAMVGGQPLLFWTLQASAVCDRIAVSTDDEAIANYTLRTFGFPRRAVEDGAVVGGSVTICHAPTVVRRPLNLASDTAPLEPVIEHALSVLGWDTHDACVVLQPTSPLRTHRHVAAALSHLAEGADSVLAVRHCPEAAFCGRLNGESFRHYAPVANRPRTQDINSYCDTGALYAFRPAWFREHRVRFGGDVRAVVLSSDEAVDVDTAADLRRAHELITANKKGGLAI